MDNNKQVIMSKNTPTEIDTPVDKGIVDAFDDFLGSNKQQQAIFTSILQDFTPRTVVTKASAGVEKTEIKQPKGFSFGSAWKIVKLAFSKPRSTFNLVKFLANKEKYNTPALHREILKKDSTWSFVKTTADNLDNIGVVMEGFGVEMFQENGLLDKKALASLKGALTDQTVLDSLKSIALESRKPQPDNLQMASSLLGMMSKSSDFRQYFQDKGNNIQDYIVSSLKDKIAQEAKDRQEWQSIGQDKQKQLQFLKARGITGDARDKILNTGKLPDSLEETMKGYGLKPNDLDSLLDIIPPLLNRPGDLQKIVDQLRAGDYIALTKNVLELAEHTPKLQEYLNNNKEIFGQVIESMMKENAAFQSSGLSGKVYNIVPALFDHPKELNNIIDLYEKGDYIKIGQEFFSLIKQDESLRRYFQNQTADIKNFTVAMMQQTIEQNHTASLEENAKWSKMTREEKVNYLNTNDQWKDKTEEEKQAILKDGLPKSMKETLESYGISTNDLNDIANIVPILLKKT